MPKHYNENIVLYENVATTTEQHNNSNIHCTAATMAKYENVFNEN